MYLFACSKGVSVSCVCAHERLVCAACVQRDPRRKEGKEQCRFLTNAADSLSLSLRGSSAFEERGESQEKVRADARIFIQATEYMTLSRAAGDRGIEVAPGNATTVCLPLLIASM